MPDFTIEIMAQCANTGRTRTVQGSGGATYEVRTHSRGQFDPHCTCPAFKFSKGGRYGVKMCKHVEAVLVEDCQYHEMVHGKPADGPNPGEKVCPLCGGAIEYVRVAV